MNNIPFVFGKAATGENFTDRKLETKRLQANFLHSVNTILISPRRWGKTSLIKKVIDIVASDKLKIVFIDIFPCRTPDEFYNRFAESVIKQTSSKSEEWFENVKTFLSRFNPRIILASDPATEMSVTLDIKSQKQDSVNDILELPEKIAKKKNCRVVVCIDEFQQIGEFKDSLNFQRNLRSVWQHQQLTSYCLFGSKKHLMSELFEKTNHPFYKFGDVIFLKKIATEDWISFIVSRFKETGKKISRQLARNLCEKVENQSNYVQQLAWITWVNTPTAVTGNILLESYEEMLNHNSMMFEQMTESLTETQLNFLKAIAQGITNGFSKKENLETYKLGTSANIKRIKDALLKEDLIEISNSMATIPDPLFKEWILRKF